MSIAAIIYLILCNIILLINYRINKIIDKKIENMEKENDKKSIS